MIRTGLLNPNLLSLLARVRHTNKLVIADRGFPYWPEIETVDLSLIDGIPTVLEVLKAIRPNFVVGKAWMAGEFLNVNSAEVVQSYREALSDVELTHDPHDQFKLRVPGAIGLIRTGETIQYANMILESA